MTGCGSGAGGGIGLALEAAAAAALGLVLFLLANLVFFSSKGSKLLGCLGLTTPSNESRPYSAVVQDAIEEYLSKTKL
jgi:hypothetical protein